MERRLIDANALCEGRVSNDPVVIAAKCAPTIDAVEVVRCRDCKYFKFGDYCYHDGPMEHSHAREDDYCSYGVRRKPRGE